MSEFALTQYDAMRSALVATHSIDEVKDIRDKAEALRQYAKQAGESLENQNLIAEIKLRAQRRMGEISLQLPTAQGTRTDLTSDQPGQKLLTKEEILDEVGISNAEKGRIEAIAAIPEPLFEEHIARTVAKREELTSAGIQKLAKQQRSRSNQQIYRQNGQASFEPQAAPAIRLYNFDARDLAGYVSDVDLVITSPPYNVGIDYDTYVDDNPEYWPVLKEVLSACHSVLVDGGRIAVVVPFGVGRKPYVPLAYQVMQTLVTVGFALRGQIIWDKGTTGNRTSWGSYRMSTNPSLRDTCECIIVAQKGGADLSLPVGVKQVDDAGSYTPWLKDGDYFMDLAQDHWQVSPESATRVGHPAPFPTELVRRLIHFYGYPGCHVLDPFAGSGTVGVVAKELGCQATLFEISEEYCRIASERIAMSLSPIGDKMSPTGDN